MSDPEQPTILEAMDALGLHGRTWRAWRAALAAIFALPMSEEELDIYRRCTGRMLPPTEPAREAWLIVGRRGGKSRISAFIAVFMATFLSYEHLLAPGEVATIPLIAADRRQARGLMRYVLGLLDSTPVLAEMVTRRTADSVTLGGRRVVIEIHTASFRSLRDYTVPVGILNEVAFLRLGDSANPDTEVLNALRPTMATVPGALLLAISSPYGRRGVLWEAYSRHYGREADPILVWQAPSQTMNPTLDPRVVERALAQDESAASAEYLARFRRDLEAYVSREKLAACVVPDRHVLPPVSAIQYVGFADPSGGSVDSMTLAIAHEADGRAVLDLVLERRPPFSPEDVTAEFCATLAQYGVDVVSGDRYAGEWPRERFDAHGVTYRVAEAVKSKIYQAFLPALNSGQVELLDEPRLLAQLLGLERRVGRGGTESIDHAPAAHDDVANAAAGALVLAANLLDVGQVAPVRYWIACDRVRSVAQIEEDERERAELAREASTKAVVGAIATTGWFWPGEGAPSRWGGWRPER